MQSGVYQITNEVNGKRYIGSAVNMDKRWKEHRRDLRANRHRNQKLQRSYNKYGKDSFSFKVIVDCSPENAIAWEQIAIDGIDPEINICRIAGSRKGVTFSKSHREKLGLIRKGVKLDPEIHQKVWKTRREKGNGKRKIESILKAAEKNTGKKRTPETIALLTIKSRMNAHKLANLTESQIIEMRNLHDAGLEVREIAEKFSIKYEKARMIVRRNIFAWVK